MDSLMDELRRLAMRFSSHKDMKSQEFALEMIQYLALYSDRETTMLAVAELFLNARPGGDGQ